MADTGTPREDGWHQVTGARWQDWPHVGTEFVESKRAEGIYIGDLVYLEFGVAEAMDPADYARCLEEVRQHLQHLEPPSGDT